MAVTPWRLRHPNIRSGRSRSSKRNEHADDINKLLNEDPYDSFKTVLNKINDQDINEEALLNYLNAFVKLTLKIDDFRTTGLKIYDIFSSLRTLLLHGSTQIRSGSMRCIRHCLKTEDDVIAMNNLLTPFLITRCLDLAVKYESERMEAMKLMRKSLIISPINFDKSMAKSLVSLANEGSESKDRLLRICLAILSELGVLNSKLFISIGGVSAITRNLLECQTPKIAESLCGVLLLLLDREETRNIARIDLHTVAAPFCDFHYKHGWKEKSGSSRRDEHELRLNCSRLALLTILRSWPGILHFCSPNDRAGFKAIVDVLHLNQLEVRKAVLDLLYELLGLPQPEWTDELSVAISAVDPCEPQSSWRLNEGFVAAEGRSVLPHLSKTTPSTTDMHLALLLYCFLENGLLDALTEVISTSDTFISVRATVLLGELLRLIHVLLPPECCNISPSLPNLLDYATKNKPQAMEAVTALQQLHKLMKKRPASYSLHLDYILKSGSGKKPIVKQEKPVKPKSSSFKSKLHQFVLKNTEDMLKETGVLMSNDAFTWDWNLINIILGDSYRNRIDLLDSSHRLFIKRLIEFFMPSNNKYSHTDLSTSKTSQTYTTTGIQLLEYIIHLNEDEYISMVIELFKDICNNILAITSGKTVHDCLFSPQHMMNTHCQSYFLFIGRLATIDLGIKILNSIGMFNNLENLATKTNNDCYVKLIISSLDYSTDGPARKLLQAVLTCDVENSRLYATQFLLVLLRANLEKFSGWGIEFLLKQLKDSSRSVRLSALYTLHEACEVPECLESLIELNPDLTKLGEKGMLLSVRFLSSENSIELLNNRSGIEKVIHEWDVKMNYRYVRLVEGDMADALTLHQRNDNGRYDKRANSNSLRGTNKKDVFLQPHLYGQLNQHQMGFKLLTEFGSVNKLMNTIKERNCSDDKEIMELKAAIWAIGHFACCPDGLNLITINKILENLIGLVQNCSVYSIRATAFFALCLISTTKSGVDELLNLGWISTRHNRHEFWPIIKDDVSGVVNSFNECGGATFLSDDVLSDSSCVCDFENDDSMNEILDSPDGVRRVRQLTLPTNKTPTIVFHKRSFSESKTFDLSLEEERPSYKRRMRNSSVTESTTSGVSSCDSHLCCKTIGADQTLSTIPSSSSLSTIIFHVKSNSESSHRNSATNSDASSSSIVGSYSSKLGFQDLVGYSTIRYLRRLRLMKTDPNQDEIRTYMKHNPNFFSPRNSTNTNDLSMIDWSFTSMFSVQKFPINSASFYSTVLKVDKCYMGICLPLNLVNMFPKQQDLRIVPVFVPSDNLEPNLSKDGCLIHGMNKCFQCYTELVDDSQMQFKEIKDASKLEILKNIERLANPVWNRHVKQILYHNKQRDPDLFKDLCIYSQVCVMLAENTYRLMSRRFIHELFLDITFKSKNVLECDSKKGVHKTS